MPLLDLGGVVGPIRSRISKDPAFFRGHSFRAPLQNNLGQGRMQWNIVLGVFGLDIVHPAVHETALNEELVFVEIEFVPLKRRNLAHAKTEALGYLDHRAPRLLQCRNDEFELLDSERSRALPALAATFHANQSDRVPSLVEEFHRVAHPNIRCQLSAAQPCRRSQDVAAVDSQTSPAVSAPAPRVGACEFV
jgi:hypothetical protein